MTLWVDVVVIVGAGGGSGIGVGSKAGRSRIPKDGIPFCYYCFGKVVVCLGFVCGCLFYCSFERIA